MGRAVYGHPARASKGFRSGSFDAAVFRRHLVIRGAPGGAVV